MSDTKPNKPDVMDVEEWATVLLQWDSELPHKEQLRTQAVYHLARHLAKWQDEQQSEKADEATPCDNCGTIGAHDCSEPDNHPAIPPSR